MSTDASRHVFVVIRENSDHYVRIYIDASLEIAGDLAVVDQEDGSKQKQTENSPMLDYPHFASVHLRFFLLLLTVGEGIADHCVCEMSIRLCATLRTSVVWVHCSKHLNPETRNNGRRLSF